jgi:hypothetical protein
MHVSLIFGLGLVFVLFTVGAIGLHRWRASVARIEDEIDQIRRDALRRRQGSASAPKASRANRAAPPAEQLEEAADRTEPTQESWVAESRDAAPESPEAAAPPMELPPSPPVSAQEPQASEPGSAPASQTEAPESGPPPIESYVLVGAVRFEAAPGSQPPEARLEGNAGGGLQERGARGTRSGAARAGPTTSTGGKGCTASPGDG